METGKRSDSDSNKERTKTVADFEREVNSYQVIGMLPLQNSQSMVGIYKRRTCPCCSQFQELATINKYLGHLKPRSESRYSNFVDGLSEEVRTGRERMRRARSILKNTSSAPSLSEVRTLSTVLTSSTTGYDKGSSLSRKR